MHVHVRECIRADARVLHRKSCYLYETHCLADSPSTTSMSLFLLRVTAVTTAAEHAQFVNFDCLAAWADRTCARSSAPSLEPVFSSAILARFPLVVADRDSRYLWSVSECASLLSFIRVFFPASGLICHSAARERIEVLV